MERPLKCDVVYFDTKPAAWNARKAFGQVPVFRFQCTKVFQQHKISFRDCDASFSLPRRLPFFSFRFFFSFEWLCFASHIKLWLLQEKTQYHSAAESSIS